MQRSPAFVRNRDAILEAMKESGLAKCERILEIGSGPGEHCPYFATHLEESPVFQPTDLHEAACVSSDEHARSRGCFGTKVLKAKVLDVADDEWPLFSDHPFDGGLAINVLHIAPHEFLESFFRGVSAALKTGGLLGIYDTWTFAGKFVGPNNEHFDRVLTSLGFSGIPSIEACDAAAEKANMTRKDLLYLPANNQFAVYAKL
mmetsp:Transcript_18489/g.59626  ORF Transcript_18489/g.59626 Transcript_18489/m.59626 type:complete len:203 (-) Transcript_18489:80-688(-)